MPATPATPTPAAWPAQFRAETAAVLGDPFFACLAEALATVECAGGARVISGALPGGGVGLNEIGYKALPGHPSVEAATHEASGAGGLAACRARFRLFASRAEQARALAHLLHASPYYDAARLLFVLAFYAAYAPGRTAGARALLRVFNQLAAGGAYPGLAPLRLGLQPNPPAAAHNHAAARQAVRLFAALTGGAPLERAGEPTDAP